MPIYNNPAIGQGFENIAAMFAPPSGSDAAAWAVANAKNAEARRQQEFYDKATAAGVAPSIVDQYGVASGAILPTQTYRALDIESGDRRYDTDVDARTAMTTNAADNARALATNAATVQGGIEQQKLQSLAGFYGPLGEDQVRPAVPSDVAALYGAAGAIGQAEGRSSPLSSDEAVAAAMRDMPAGDVQRIARDKFAPTESQVKGEERRRLAADGMLDDETLLDAIVGERAPVETIGPDGRPAFMAPGRAIRTGAQPAPGKPLVSVNTGDAPDGDLRRKLDENEGKRWSDLQASAVTGSGLQQDLGALSELIDQAPQGPLVGRLAEYFPETTTAGAAFQSIIARAAPGLRVEGSGATSDIEYEGMVKSLPRLRNDPEANRLIVETMRAKADVNIRRGEIVGAYQNGEIGAADARKALGELNRRSIMSPGLRAMIDPSRPESETGAVRDETSVEPVRVSSPDEARRLPSGTPILLPDGRQGRVP